MRNNVTLKKQEREKEDAGEETQRDRKVAASRVCWLLNTDNIWIYDISVGLKRVDMSRNYHRCEPDTLTCINHICHQRTRAIATNKTHVCSSVQLLTSFSSYMLMLLLGSTGTSFLHGLPSFLVMKPDKWKGASIPQFACFIGGQICRLRHQTTSWTTLKLQRRLDAENLLVFHSKQTLSHCR